MKLLNKIFYPDSVVVVGVSERPDNLAANIVGNLVSFGYGGDIYAVGLRSGEVHGVPILDSVELLPDGVDLAVILTPAATVPGPDRGPEAGGTPRVPGVSKWY